MSTSSLVCSPLAAYNSLTDVHLVEYFSSPRRLRHLRRMGLVSESNTSWCPATVTNDLHILMFIKTSLSRWFAPTCRYIPWEVNICNYMYWSILCKVDYCVSTAQFRYRNTVPSICKVLYQCCFQSVISIPLSNLGSQYCSRILLYSSICHLSNEVLCIFFYFTESLHDPPTWITFSMLRTTL